MSRRSKHHTMDSKYTKEKIPEMIKVHSESHNLSSTFNSNNSNIKSQQSTDFSFKSSDQPQQTHIEMHKGPGSVRKWNSHDENERKMSQIKENEIEAWLASIGMTHYLDNFLSNGYESIPIIKDIKSAEELMDIKVERNAAKAIFTEIKSMRRSLHEDRNCHKPKDGDHDNFGAVGNLRQHKQTSHSVGEEVDENGMRNDEFIVSSGDENDFGNFGRQRTIGAEDDEHVYSELDDIPNNVGNDIDYKGEDYHMEGGGVDNDSDVGVMDEDGYVTHDYHVRQDEFVVMSDHEQDYPKGRKITLGDKKDVV